MGARPFSQHSKCLKKNFLQKIADHDEAAFRTLFDRYYPALVRYGIKILGIENVAEEIVQDLFVEIWQKRSKLTIEHSFSAYAHRFARNKCIDYIKSKYHQVQRDTIEPTSQLRISEDTVESELIGLELAEAIADLENSLPQQTKLVFSLSRHGELTYGQIASQLDISVKTVEYHISKSN